MLIEEFFIDIKRIERLLDDCCKFLCFLILNFRDILLLSFYMERSMLLNIDKYKVNKKYVEIKISFKREILYFLCFFVFYE